MNNRTKEKVDLEYQPINGEEDDEENKQEVVLDEDDYLNETDQFINFVTLPGSLLGCIVGFVPIRILVFLFSGKKIILPRFCDWIIPFVVSCVVGTMAAIDDDQYTWQTFVLSEIWIQTYTTLSPLLIMWTMTRKSFYSHLDMTPQYSFVLPLLLLWVGYISLFIILDLMSLPGYTSIITGILVEGNQSSAYFFAIFLVQFARQVKSRAKSLWEDLEKNHMDEQRVSSILQQLEEMELNVKTFNRDVGVFVSVIVFFATVQTVLTTAGMFFNHIYSSLGGEMISISTIIMGYILLGMTLTPVASISHQFASLQHKMEHLVLHHIVHDHSSFREDSQLASFLRYKKDICVFKVGPLSGNYVLVKTIVGLSFGIWMLYFRMIFHIPMH